MDNVVGLYVALFLFVALLPTGKAVYNAGDAVQRQGGFSRPVEDCAKGWEPMCSEPF